MADFPFNRRFYRGKEDYWRIRAFLRAVFVKNGYRQISWHVARFDYARWHTILNCARLPMEELVVLWETGGELAAVLMPDGGRGEAHFLVDPDSTTPQLEESMLLEAETYLAGTLEGGRKSLELWTPEEDTARKDLFRKHGYAPTGVVETQWRCDLQEISPQAPVLPGYTFRSLGDGLELLERCYASGLGFHEGDITIGIDNRSDPGWYRDIQTAPLYRRDLDIIAAAADGSIAAFCTIWFDDVTRSAYFEPVATVPAHQRRGLGRAVMTEGLVRLKRLGASRAFVSGYGEAANSLYRSVFGPDQNLSEVWKKEWA